MSRTKEEFSRRWRHHVAGIIALGGSDVRKIVSGPVESADQFGRLIFRLAETADQLLSQLYDDLMKDTNQKNGTNGTVSNGTPTQPQQKVKS